MWRSSDSGMLETIRPLGYRNFYSTGKSIIGTGGYSEVVDIAGTEGRVHSLEWPVDGAEGWVSARGLASTDALKVVLAEAVDANFEILELSFSIPSDSVPL